MQRKKLFSDEEKIGISSFPHYRPKFQFVGYLTNDQRLLLGAIEELFFIKFVENDNVDLDQQRDIVGKIICLPKNLKKLDNSKFFLEKKIPNLILNITEVNYLVVPTLINKKLSGIVLECQNYYISPNGKAFGPLKGINISGRVARNVFAFTPSTELESLISSKGCCIFGKLGDTYISAVGLPDNLGNCGLNDYFNDLNFMGILPLFFFLSECLGVQKFKPVKIRACCIIDDANIRMSRYGYMKYSDIAKSAVRNNYSIAVGMIPIDYKKIGRKALNILKMNNSRLSVIMHGNNHLKNEMLISSTKQQKRKILEQALWRMNHFSNKTGLKFSRAMVFPHDRGSIYTIRMMRKIGFQALFMQMSYPIDIKHEYKTINSLLEMFPSDNSVEGFPIINRHSMEAHYSDHNWQHKILFHAWLGKPIIPWTHHYFFKYGLEEIEEKIDFINRHISPEWTNILEILNGNYTIANRKERVYINIYSNILTIDVPDNVREIILTKHGRNLPIKEETLIVNGTNHDWVYKSSDCLSTLINVYKQPIIRLEIIPNNAKLGGEKHLPDFRAYLRRYLTEFRDQTETYFKWSDKFINAYVFTK